MKSDGKDPYDIKKFEEVLDESKMMIPDSRNRLKRSIDELKEFMTSNEDDLTNEEWISTAKNVTESA